MAPELVFLSYQNNENVFALLETARKHRRERAEMERQREIAVIERETRSSSSGEVRIRIDNEEEEKENERDDHEMLEEGEDEIILGEMIAKDRSRAGTLMTYALFVGLCAGSLLGPLINFVLFRVNDWYYSKLEMVLQ